MVLVVLSHFSAHLLSILVPQYAYRLTETRKFLNKFDDPIVVAQNMVVWKHDNNDDGEDGAGKRLSHLLEMRNEDGVLVVVSRWFGGIQLGPKRFAHITSTAQVLLAAMQNQPTKE